MPEPRHPDRDTLESFSRGALSAEQAQRIEDHLRSGCPVCQRKVDDLLWQLQTASQPAWTEEEQIWSRLLVKLEHRMELIEQERAVAPGLVAELLAASPPGEREALLRSGRFQTIAVCELLIERSFAEGFQDPARARELADLAVQVADRLDMVLYGRSVVQDFRARAWAYLGNARRLGSDLKGAEEALSLAEYFSEEGSADPLEEARILDLKASLLSDQGHLEQAAGLLDVVIDIYEDIRDVNRQGRALISKGLFLAYASQPEQGLDWISRGLELIRGEQEPRLVLMANHNIAWCLTDCGRAEEAQRHLDGIRHLYDGFFDPWTRLRLGWLEARIAAGLGRREEAERKLHELRDAFVEQRLGYDASIVTLDLAALYLEQGRTAEVRRLAEEALPVLLAQDIHREAMAALIAFQQATEIERATPQMVQQVAAYLYRARKNPELRFEGWEPAGG
jgi:tetratricopeptide (TPR) repeat protein